MLRRSAPWFLATLLIPLFAGAALEESDEPIDDPRDAWVSPDRIGGLYEAECAVCHGPNLEGAAQGPSLLTDELLHGDDVAGLVLSIADGYPDKAMPAWANALRADQIRSLAIYILEKRATDRGDAGMGLGDPPVIPSSVQSSEEHSFRFESLMGGITDPYSIAPLPDGRVLLTEKAVGLSIVSADGETKTLVTGTPKIYADGHVRGATYTGNGWAHEVALHPEYEDNGWIYFSYGDRCDACTAESRESGEPAAMLALVRGRIVDGVWKDEETIWKPRRSAYVVGMENGIGARIAFDNAGYVYLSVGNMRSDYSGIQDLDTPYGKMLRLHDDGRIPEDNPFVGVAGALPEIWSYGHRNPQGLDFDPHTDRLWSSEHGPRGGDEMNIIEAGKNYGWPLVSLGLDYDGAPISYGAKLGIDFNPENLTPPVIDWTPSNGVSSIVFYRGGAFPRWQNNLFVATLKQNELLRVAVDRDAALHIETVVAGLARFRDVEIGPGGIVYLLLEHTSGSQILRLVPVE